MPQETYYKDHWVEIEPDRLDRYEAQFAWGARGNRLIDGADIRVGHVVADYGCRPGFLSVELARRVGPGGQVQAFDVNADFVARTESKLAAEGFAPRSVVTHLQGDMLPLEDNSLDRLIIKNVMSYVDDPLASLREFRRVVKPGGKVHAIDSDFYMAAFNPISPLDWHHVLDAAIHAFRTPEISRRLYGLALAEGYGEVAVEVIAGPDTTGRMFNVIQNMAGYAREGGNHDEAIVQRVLVQSKRAVEDGTFFAVNPQFLVTATV